MKVLILIAAVIQLTSASFLISPRLQKIQALNTLPVKAVSGTCDEANLRMCQRKFNEKLEISSDADFENVDILATDINEILLKQDVEQGLLKICLARSLFYQCLGSSYEPCMNRLHYLRAGQNLTAAITFVRLFRELEFMCNGGLLQSVREWECIKKNQVEFSKETDKCYKTYEQEMVEHPEDLCTNAQHMMLCNRNPYQINCGKSVGWWGCESIRVSLDIDNHCPHLTCSYSLFPEGNKVAKSKRLRSKRDLFRSQNPQFMRPEKMNLLIQLGAKATERNKRRKRSVQDEE